MTKDNKKTGPEAMNRFKGVKLVAALLAGSVLLAGCGDDMSDLRAYVEEVKARKTAPPKAIPDIKPYESFAYPNHVKSPFDASILASAPDVTNTNIPELEEDRPREYLENFPLDSLDMVGTLEQANTLWALIKTPDGTIQRVTLENYMGQNNGKIMKITPTRLTLKEYIRDEFGGYIERETVVAISE
jgi:type IV pilus assembly protein PilP